MKIFLYSFSIAFIIGLLIDSLWLFLMVKRLYYQYIGHLMAKTPDFVSAGFFYLIYVFGITFFIIMPAINGNHSLLKVFAYGALFGFIAYSTYDLTNQATLKDWPVIITLIDIAWGTFFTGILSAITFYIIRIIIN